MASRSWNRVELIGNLTRDPELRYTPNGAAVATFGIATNRTYMTDGEKKEEVDFHRLVAWNKLAELCSQLLKKGNRVFVSGRLQTRSWEGQDGQSRQTTEIVLEDMILLTPKGSSEGYSEDVSSGVIESAPDLPVEPVETPAMEKVSGEAVTKPDEPPAAETPEDSEDKKPPKPTAKEEV